MAEEYAYDGGNQIRSLSPNPNDELRTCAVSANNGDIAFTLTSSSVLVFKGGAQSKTTTYSLPGTPYFAGYDAKNDLYVDAANAESYAFFELPAHGTSFEIVSLPNTLQSAGRSNWDGKYVAVTDRLAGAIYRYEIAGSVAALKGTVLLKDTTTCGGTWIASPYVFCANDGKRAAAVYKYPAGGGSIATFKGDAGNTIVQVSK